MRTPGEGDRRRRGTTAHRAAASPFAFEYLERRQLLTATTLVITKGGTYTGTWESDDPKVAAVTIKTADPVIIENSTIKSKSDLIVTGVDHVNVTIRNTTGTALNPNVAGQSPGRFFSAFNFDNADIENNDLENTSGIHLLQFIGDPTKGDTIKVIRNKARDIDGRKSDGTGGWMTFNARTNISTGVVEAGFTEAQFVQLDKDINVPNVEIAWNQVINDPGNSRVEDNISIFCSGGTATSPILIHDNYIDGAYTINPTQGSYSDATYKYDWSYSGGGIMLGDGTTFNPGYVRAYDNQVVDTTNYGIAESAGHDLEAFDNRVISAGVVSGKAIAAQNVGIYVWDSYKKGVKYFYNDSAHDNAVGWVKTGGRNDWWAPIISILDDNTHWSGDLTTATETAETTRWLAKSDPATGAAPHATLAGTIFNDANGDGIIDPTDAGAGGFRVYIDSNRDGTWEQNEPIVRTTSKGRWQFFVDPGSYVVRIQHDPGWRATKGDSATLKVGALGDSATRYLAMSASTLITGMVYMDANKDGGRQSAEPGLAGWQVFDDANNNGILDAGEISAITNAAGRYAFIGLSAGVHQIRVIFWLNYRLTSPGAGYRSVSLAAGDIVEGRNFGEKRLPRS